MAIRNNPVKRGKASLNDAKRKYSVWQRYGKVWTTKQMQKCEGQSTKWHTYVHTLYVTDFGEIGLNAANNFFQYPWVKPYGSIFFENFFMAEMDRHQLALAYDAL